MSERMPKDRGHIPGFVRESIAELENAIRQELVDFLTDSEMKRAFNRAVRLHAAGLNPGAKL